MRNVGQEVAILKHVDLAELRIIILLDQLAVRFFWDAV